MLRIEAERADKHNAVRALHLEAFPGPDEAALVDRLRLHGDSVFSLVAIEGDRVVGHAMFSRMRSPERTLGLAPVAVAADRRRLGIAAAIIDAGLTRATEGGWRGVYVLGDPNYYGRFGFSIDAARPFASPYAGPHFMLRLLAKSAPPSGRADYALAFDAL